VTSPAAIASLGWYTSRTTTNPIAAIAREKELKGWLRARKIALVEKDNPKWPDLAEELMLKKAEQQILRCARDDIRSSG